MNGPLAIMRRIHAGLWKRTDDDRYFRCLSERSLQPFAHLDMDIVDAAMSARMLECNSFQQEEYVHQVTTRSMIDPGTGFVIVHGQKLLTPSLPYSYQAREPFIARSLAAQAGLVPVLRFDRVISFRDVNEANYFHFFNDVLTKIPLLQDHGLLNAPVIVGRSLFRTPFFQEVLPRLQAAGLRIVDQGARFVQADEIIYCKSMPHERGYLERVLELIDAPQVPDAPGRKVFLTRRPSTANKRLIANAEEVEQWMIANGFEVHDTDRLSLREQMVLFAGTRWLVAVHGAAETNMLFRRDAPMDLLELFPGESIPPHYYWLAKLFGHGYQGLTCGNSSSDGRFHVPMDPLIAAVDRMVAKD